MLALRIPISNTLKPTYPSAITSLCLLRTGYSNGDIATTAGAPV